MNHLWIAAFAASLCAASPGLAQEMPVPIVPKSADDAIDPTSFDISGVWEYATYGHSVAGDCPVGHAFSGIFVLAKEGNAVSLVFETGAKCDPASMCNFTGQYEDGFVSVSVTDTVDEEGGEATSALALYFFSETHGSGNGGSRYTHPKGFECEWSYKFDFHRPVVKDDEWERGLSGTKD